MFIILFTFMKGIVKFTALSNVFYNQCTDFLDSYEDNLYSSHAGLNNDPLINKLCAIEAKQIDLECNIRKPFFREIILNFERKMRLQRI